jgi:hypothetical protein
MRWATRSDAGHLSTLGAVPGAEKRRDPGRERSCLGMNLPPRIPARDSASWSSPRSPVPRHTTLCASSPLGPPGKRAQTWWKAATCDGLDARGTSMSRSLTLTATVLTPALKSSTRTLTSLPVNCSSFGRNAHLTIAQLRKATPVSAPTPRLRSWARAIYQRQGVGPSSDAGRNVSSNNWPRHPNGK